MDVICVIYENNVPELICQALPGLYQSCFAVMEYMRLFRNHRNLNAMTISNAENEILHVIIFNKDVRDVSVLNEVFEIGPFYINKFCGQIYEKYPLVKRIFFNAVKTDLAKIEVPFVLARVLDMHAINLPDNFADYKKMLSRTTRQHIQNGINKLNRDYPENTFQLTTTADISKDLIDSVFEMNRLRMQRKRRMVPADAKLRGMIFQIAREYGFVATISIKNEIVSAAIGFEVLGNYYIKILAHNNAYGRYHPGMACLFLLIQHCIEREGKVFNLLWGDFEYKAKLQAKRDSLYSVVLFRTSLARFLFYGSLINLVRNYLQVIAKRGRYGLNLLLCILSGFFYNFFVDLHQSEIIFFFTKMF